MLGYVYLIENKTNSKKYIGKTYKPIEQRWKEHLQESKRIRSQNRPLYNAIILYGQDNFSISEIERCENCEEREKYWIQFYDSYKNGYNATLGGDGKPYFEYSDKEVIQKYNELRSIQATADFYECDTYTISTRLKNNNIEISLGGDIFSEKRIKPPKAIKQFSLTGELIQSFISCGEAAQWIIDNNVSSGNKKGISNHISEVTDGKRNTAYGYIWKKESEDIDSVESISINHGRSKPVAQIDVKTNEIIQRYESITDASNAFRKPKDGQTKGGSMIGKACSGKLATAYGYKWKFI